MKDFLLALLPELSFCLISLLLYNTGCSGGKKKQPLPISQQKLLANK
jgi:hypothetical protein